MNNKSALDAFQDLHDAWVNLWDTVAKEMPFGIGQIFRWWFVTIWEHNS